MTLSNEELERYHRQILLPEFGRDGQEKLAQANVLVVGVGGLGSPVLTYLAGAGVGTIGIVDPEKIELSNLHRQILYNTDDIGKPKVEIAGRRLAKRNPSVKIVPHALRVVADNVQDLINGYDLILDCSDNFETRYLMNDACLAAGKTLVHGAIFRAEGQAMIIKPGVGPCLRCLFAKPPRVSKVEGVFGPTAGMIGLVMATEAIKQILDVGNRLIGQLLIYNTIEMRFRKIDVVRNKNCPTCGSK
jgi:adenylyltransferase/sulfurtransferase